MNPDLKNYSTFKIGSTAYRILNIRNETDIISALSYADKCEKELLIIGEGSNSIFSDEEEKFIIGHMQIKGIHVKEDTEEYQVIRVSAGESWDEFVAHTVKEGLTGIEALSGIPGTVGAAPIQNIGAYGTELSDVLVNVSMYDLETQRFKTLKAEDCKLSYRDSIFKQEPGKYILTEITVKLSKTKPVAPEYESLKGMFDSQEVTGELIRQAVLTTRAKKLPDYKTTPNCGSFFKNPIVTLEEFNQIKGAHPETPSFETESGHIKLYAGWMIEHVNYQSLETPHIGFYEHNKLVLFNKGDATFEELSSVVSGVQDLVYDAFGIELEPEPNFFF